jgi:TonB family protein
VIDENGKVSSAQVVQGNAALADSAVKAVKQWRYRPYIRDGKVVPFETVVQIDFPRP